MKQVLLLSLICGITGQSLAVVSKPTNSMQQYPKYTLDQVQKQFPHAYTAITTKGADKLDKETGEKSWLVQGPGKQTRNEGWSEVLPKTETSRSPLKTVGNGILAGLAFWGASKYFDTQKLFAGVLGIFGLYATKNLAFESKNQTQHGKTTLYQLQDLSKECPEDFN